MAGRDEFMQQLRRTASQWTSDDPTLLDGQIGYESDTRKFKVGDGSTAWSSLNYIEADDSDAIHDNVSGEVNAVAEKVAPVGADILIIEDSAASYAKKKVQITNLPGGADADAIHDNVASEISAITEKTTPVSADLLIIEDSADSNNKKRVQIGNLPIGETLNISVSNNSGGDIGAGNAVYISGWDTPNDLPEISKADSDAAATMPAFGILPSAISNGATGVVTVSGIITMNTTGLGSAGDNLYVSSGTAGELTSTKPTDPNLIQKVGILLKVGASGTVAVVGAGRTNDTPNETTQAMKFLDDHLLIENPAGTFDYTIQAAAIGADRTLNLPLLTETDTVAVLGVAQEYTKTQNFDETTLTDGATINWDLSSNQVCSVTLAGNRTMAAPTNMTAGSTYILVVKQDATPPRTITWNAVFKWSGGTAPTLSTGANDIDIISFYCDGTNMYGVASLDFS